MVGRLRRRLPSVLVRLFGSLSAYSPLLLVALLAFIIFYFRSLCDVF